MLPHPFGSKAQVWDFVLSGYDYGAASKPALALTSILQLPEEMLVFVAHTGCQCIQNYPWISHFLRGNP